jgi:hypothetical protein
MAKPPLWKETSMLKNWDLRIFRIVPFAALFVIARPSLAAVASLDECPNLSGRSQSPHCIAQQQFCAAYSSVPVTLAQIQSASRFTDPRDLLAVAMSNVSAVNTTGLTLNAMGADAANALATNIIEWTARNRSRRCGRIWDG